MLELLYKRRSIRKFKQTAVPAELTAKLTEALLLSPSSRNRRPWRFIIITNPEVIRRTADAKEHGTAALDTAPLAIAVIGENAKSDVWVEDCSIASIIVQLEAESIGLGSCWIQIRNRHTAEGISSEQYLRELYGLSETDTVESVIALGFPAESHPPLRTEDLDFNKIGYIE